MTENEKQKRISINGVNRVTITTKSPRIVREKQTILAMARIYCRDHHDMAGELQ